MSPRATTTLACDARAPARAREFLRDFGCIQQTEMLETAQLLVSEVVTNAVRHGVPPLELDIKCDDSTTLEARVCDGSAKVPVLLEAREWDESGRGLELVELLSDAWGIQPTDHGKAVWFRLKF